MREIKTLTFRIIKLYLKNPLSILFSFVYMLMFIVLISLFLGDYLAQGMIKVYSEVEGMNFSTIRWLVDSTSLAGVLMINCILIPLNVLAIMVQDSNDNKLDSFIISPVSSSKLVIGYWLAPFIIGIIMNIICLFISEGFIVVNGGKWLDFKDNIIMFFLIIVNTFSTTSILFVLALLIKKSQLYNTFTGIMSALVGFITGAFLPIGMFPENIQKLFAFIPAHHGATMMREIMTKNALIETFRNVSDQFVKGTFMTSQEIVDIYAMENGIIYMFGNTNVEFNTMLFLVVCSGILFLILSIILQKKFYYFMKL